MKWLTWAGIGVDRMASAWLIKTRIDPNAEFLFVPAGQQPLPADTEPFDIPGARYAHHHGHCTFCTLLKSYGIRDAVLDRIAAIVDEADSVQETPLEPAASGLDMICRGMRRISSSDDEAVLRGMEVYEALYAEIAEDPGLSQD